MDSAGFVGACILFVVEPESDGATLSAPAVRLDVLSAPAERVVVVPDCELVERKLLEPGLLDVGFVVGDGVVVG